MHKNPARAQAGPHETPKLQQELDTRYNRTCRGNAAGSKQLKLNQHNRHLFIILSQNKNLNCRLLINSLDYLLAIVKKCGKKYLQLVSRSVGIRLH